MDILKFNKTFTTKFILPLLFEQYTDYTEIFNNSFINAYIGDIKNKEYDDKIILMFSDYPSITITKKLPDSIAEYMADDMYILVYDLPKEYNDEYHRFLEGNYHKFDEEAKRRILSFWKCNENTLIYKVLSNDVEGIQYYLKDKKLKIKTSTFNTWFSPIIKYEIMGVQ
jgi:hypothetical protein